MIDSSRVKSIQPMPQFLLHNRDERHTHTHTWRNSKHERPRQQTVRAGGRYSSNERSIHHTLYTTRQPQYNRIYNTILFIILKIYNKNTALRNEFNGTTTTSGVECVEFKLHIGLWRCVGDHCMLQSQLCFLPNE